MHPIRKDLRFQQGREKERKEGEKQLAARLRQEKNASATRMKREGITVELIVRITGLSKSQVEKL